MLLRGGLSVRKQERKDIRRIARTSGCEEFADETVSFAVIDFDKSSWRRDALAVVWKLREVGLPVALERSRSGKGALYFACDERRKKYFDGNAA